MTISIHAPRVGSDSDVDIDEDLRDISIHAPRVGSDPDRRLRPEALYYFNPRSPCGERQRAHGRQDGRGSFQSTLPVWGATARARAFHAPSAFQSTLPVWGATAPSRLTGKIKLISIHAPRVGSDRGSMPSRVADRDFNPRSPCGERPAKRLALH